MTRQRLMSLVRKALDTYNMISPGDKVAVGLSGGKDSIALLHALSGLKMFYPASFELYAVTADLGFGNLDTAKLVALCEELRVPLTIINTDIADIVFNIKKEKNPCALCAKLRKGAINTALADLGCNKLAYAHHKDDIIDTFALSLIYEGRLHSFAPVTYLDRTRITVIRPLMYVYEAEIKGFINEYNIDIIKNPCPVDGNTRRAYVKTMIAELNRDNPGVKSRIFTAITNGLENYRPHG